ncbi:B-cell receptor CD22-like [Ptychodera flava]|uniref:B-cell receptor CD22-like n=1 Tax=Ptychodera flava TaxID=63121 RepID=UPI003969E097
MAVRSRDINFRPRVPLQRTVMLYWLSFTMSMNGCGALSFSVTPVDTIVVRGKDTQLNCSFDNWSGEILSWHKVTPRSFQISNGATVVVPGYQLIEQYGTGKYSMGLFNTTADQEGVHRCDAFVFPPLQAAAELFVIEKWLDCTVSPGATVKEQEEVVFTCSADRGAPPGELLWLMDGDITSVETNSSKIDWKYSFNRSESGAVVDCYIRHVTLPPPLPSCKEEIIIEVQYGPSIVIRNGPEGVVVEGRNYQAFCDVDANPAATVYWQHPSGDTTADATLLLDSASRDQRGDYKCFANNTFWDNSTGSSEEIHSLDVQFPPSVAVPPEVACKIGESVQLTCHKIDANPSDVDYTWYLANGEMFSNATIEITNITRDLHGDQSCTASNTYYDGTYGTGSNVTFLDVQYPPEVNNSRIETKEKDTVILSCHVDSNPHPSEFQWFYEDVLLANESTYAIDDVTRDDAGNYTCTVTTVFYDNTNATDQGIVYLGVQYLSSVNITILPSRINEGDDVDIHCQASDGNPDSHKIELIFEGMPLAMDDGQELHHRINDISPQSTGSYQCRAFTIFHDDSEEYSATEAELVVYYSARLIPSNETELKVEIGEVVDINCTAHGMPVPSIKWFDTNDREISDEDDNFEIRNHQPIGNVVTSSLSITLADSTYYGEYVCEATNADDVTGDRQSTTIIELIADNVSEPLVAIITTSVLVPLILIAVIIIVVIWCRKRRPKNTNEHSLDHTFTYESREETMETTENVTFQRVEPDGTSYDMDIVRYTEETTFSSFRPPSTDSAQSTSADDDEGDPSKADRKSADDHEGIENVYAKDHKTNFKRNSQEADVITPNSPSFQNGVQEEPFHEPHGWKNDIQGSTLPGANFSVYQSNQGFRRPEIMFTDLDLPYGVKLAESEQRLPSDDEEDLTTVHWV